MGNHFAGHFKLLSEDVDCSRLVLIKHASYLELTLERRHDLAVGRTAFEPACLFSFDLDLIAIFDLKGFDFSDGLVAVDCAVHNGFTLFSFFGLWSEDRHTVEGIVLYFEFPYRQAGFVFVVRGA